MDWIRRRSACGSPAGVIRSGTRARASASRIWARRPAARAWALIAARRGQPSRQTTVAAALADQSRVALASRSVESLGNHSETMRFIVPLHEPGRDLGGGGRAEAVASELEAPARGADVVQAGRRRRRCRSEAPARRADALR